MDLHVPLQPKQIDLYNLVQDSTATWIGYGGSRGGAKSHAARAVMLIRRLEYPGSRGLLFRRLWKHLWDNHIQTYFRDWPFLKPLYSAQHKEITLPNGSVIKFGYAEYEKDIENFQGHEYMDIFPDEATHCTEKMLTFLRTCNRQTGFDDSLCKMVMTMNPGNVGHAFMKRIFLKKEYRDNENAGDYAFLQSRAWDNVEWVMGLLQRDKLTVTDFYSWTEKQRFEYFLRSDYGKKLDALPPAMRVGHLLGDWDSFAGQFFDVFVPSKHMVREELKPWYSRWISIDWGFEHNSAVHWHTTLPSGKHHTYREFVDNHLTPAQLAMKIAELSTGPQITDEGRAILGYENIDAVYISPDTKRHTDSWETVHGQFNKAMGSLGLPEALIADNDRKGGWMLMYELLRSGYWTIDPTCTVLREGLNSATHDDDDLEDIIKTETPEDDALDCARYGLKSRLGAKQAPLAERVRARVEAIHPSSETARQMAIRRAIHIEQKATDMQPFTMRKR